MPRYGKTMATRVSRAFFAQHKTANVALSKAADLSVDTSDVGVASRTAPFIISTASVDRDGDTLALKGWDLVDYKKNPIVLFDHDASKPIGRSEQIWTADNALRAIAWFPTKDVSELSDSIFKLIDAGVLRTASVTFLPLEFTQANDRAAASPWGQPPMNFVRQKLLEWSVVSVPSNQDALVQAKGLRVDWRLYKDVLEQSLDSEAAVLSAPRIEYEKTHAVVKSFLREKPPARGMEEDPMKTSKAGNVLNKDNLNRLKAAQKHMDKADEFHKDIDAMKAKAAMHMSKCAEHMKAIMDSHNAGKDDPDEGGDSGKESDDTSKKVDDDETEEKKQDGEGVEDNLNDQGSGAGNAKPTGTVDPKLPDADDYYAQYRGSKKTADDIVVERAREALKVGPKKAAPKRDDKPICDQEFTEEEVAQAVQKAVEAAYQKHLRELRGQD